VGALDAMSEVLQALDAFGLMRIGVLGFICLILIRVVSVIKWNTSIRSVPSVWPSRARSSKIICRSHPIPISKKKIAPIIATPNEETKDARAHNSRNRFSRHPPIVCETPLNRASIDHALNARRNLCIRGHLFSKAPPAGRS
jgi:hypothetical protein